MHHAGDASEAMSAIDAAWLRMDRPTNLMMICGMLLLDGRLDLARFKHVLRRRMLCFHRLRQRVVTGDGEPRWELDPDFDLGWHVRRVQHAAGVSDARVRQIAGRLASTPLDPGRPMWQFHVIDGAAGSALVLRIHHCYGDGFALLHVLDAITDLDPEHARSSEADVGRPAPRSALERLIGPLAAAVGDVVRGSFSLADAGADLLAHPAHALDYARHGADLLYQAGVLAAMAPDAPTALKGELGAGKRLAWGAPLPLPAIKAVARALGCSVNDVLVACVAGALRAWLEQQGSPAAGLEPRALVPVNLRPAGPLTDLGNHFGLVFLDLPVGVQEPVPRLLEVHRRMDALKHSQQPLLALGLLAAMGVSPDGVKERLLETLAANASLVVTNVHGPDQPRYLAGRRIARQMFWVPQSGGIALGISILSYNGEAGFGVLADALRVPDPQALSDGFVREFEALSAAVAPRARQ
jgi:WS/DGAT/MGAT family acyltransferase